MRLTDKQMQEYGELLTQRCPSMRLVLDTIYGNRVERVVGGTWRRISPEGMSRKETVAWLDGWHKSMDVVKFEVRTEIKHKLDELGQGLPALTRWLDQL